MMVLFGSVGSERSGGCVGAGGELLIEHVLAHAVVADKGEFVDEFAGCLLFLDLFADEPVELVAGGVVVLGLGYGVEVVDHRCYLLLVGEGVLEGAQRAFP